MTEHKKDPRGVENKAQDHAATPESTCKPLDLRPTTRQWRDPVTGEWLTCTAPVDVFAEERAPYNTDSEKMAESPDPYIELVKSAKTLEELFLLHRDDIIKRYARYGDHPESKQFFSRIRRWVIGLCAGRPDIPCPPLESDPAAWAMWIENIRKVIAARKAQTENAREPGRKAGHATTERHQAPAFSLSPLSISGSHRMNEAEISRIVAFLADVAQTYKELAGSFAPTRARAFIPTSEMARKIAEERKKEEEAEREKAVQGGRRCLNQLYSTVYALWDAVDETEDAGLRERLEGIAQAAVQWITLFGQYVKPEYDTLTNGKRPYRSPDRSRCHLRDSNNAWDARDRERIAEIMACPKDALKDLPCENFKERDDQDGAWAVHVAYRLAVALRHWVHAETAEEVYSYYVYNQQPCRARVRCIATAMDDLLTHWDEHNPRHAEKLSNLYADLQKAAKEKDKYYKRLSILPYWNKRDFDPRDVKARAAKLYEKLEHVAWMAHQRLKKAERESARLGQAGETPAEAKSKTTREEANIEVRRLLKETPTWDWTVRKLAENVKCSTGTISNCPAWKAYNERRDRLQKEGTIKTVSLTSEMEAVLGVGEPGEVLQQLIAEQEEDHREDTKQAKLYLSQEKKPRRRGS